MKLIMNEVTKNLRIAIESMQNRFRARSVSGCFHYAWNTTDNLYYTFKAGAALQHKKSCWNWDFMQEQVGPIVTLFADLVPGVVWKWLGCVNKAVFTHDYSLQRPVTSQVYLVYLDIPFQFGSLLTCLPVVLLTSLFTCLFGSLLVCSFVFYLFIYFPFVCLLTRLPLVCLFVCLVGMKELGTNPTWCLGDWFRWLVLIKIVFSGQVSSANSQGILSCEPTCVAIQCSLGFLFREIKQRPRKNEAKYAISHTFHIRS